MNNNFQESHRMPAFEELDGSLRTAVAVIRNEPVADVRLRRVLERARALEPLGESLHGSPRTAGDLDMVDEGGTGIAKPNSVAAAHVKSKLRHAGWSRRRLAWSSAGVAACAAALMLAVIAGRPASAMQKIAAKIREARSYTCTMSAEMTLDAPSADDGTLKRVETVKFLWTAPGSVRQERFKGDDLIGVSIYPDGKAGLSIDHSQRTFITLPEQAFRPGFDSPGHWISALARSPGKTALELGVKEIDSRPARGYLLESGSISPDIPPGISVRVWADEETRLPVLVEMESVDSKTKMRIEDFQWNMVLDAALFETTAPAGYADATPPPVTNEDKEQAIVKGFQTYSELKGGQYPKVAKIYPDQIMNDLNRQFGIPRDIREASEEMRKTSGKIHVITVGFGWVLQIQRGNSDAVYHGKIVGPNDEDKILLRWKQEAGYRALFGDLHLETITAERLKKLEAR